ncbi:MAG: nitrous oxide reductase family maturation protein NosD [Chloroflexi bacterium]|nr:nitrous oxide reductase family maturation protein NosD [Chloroflexota bacterium]
MGCIAASGKIKLPVTRWIAQVTIAAAILLAALSQAQAQESALSLKDMLAAARDGDTILVPGGTYPGPLVINKGVKLIGIDRPVINGHGQGTVVTITAPGAVMQGFRVVGSGDTLDRDESGIEVRAAGVTLEDNLLEDVLFGIYLNKAPGAVVQHNTIRGKILPLARRGDLLRLWYSRDTLVAYNTVENGRDAVFWYSTNVHIHHNTLTNSRYGIHFMFSNQNLVEDNVIQDNSVGIYLMYCDDLVVRRNIFAGNRGISGMGLGLKEMNNVLAEDNLFLDNRIGLYIDDAAFNMDSHDTIRRNVFAFNDIALSLLPNTQRNWFTENTFLENEQQVALQGSGVLEGNLWEVDGRGNYWSDYAGYDADGDGIGDVPYKNESLFENLGDSHPELRLFEFGPAAQALDFAARAFPLIKPQPKMADPAPMVQPYLPENLPGTAKQQAPWPLLMASLCFILAAVGVLWWASYPAIPAKKAAGESGAVWEQSL